MCNYVGDNNPITEIEENKCEGYVQVNPRDFLAALQRLLSTKNLANEDIILSHPLLPYKFVLETFSLHNVNPSYSPFDPSLLPGSKQQLNRADQERISLAVVKALASALEDEVVAVRETVASSLGKLPLHHIGTISLPEEIDALDALLANIKDPDSNVRAMRAWAIGRLGPHAGLKVNLILLLGNKTFARVIKGQLLESKDSSVYSSWMFRRTSCKSIIILTIKGTFSTTN
jgi:hypothetical protein